MPKSNVKDYDKEAEDLLKVIYSNILKLKELHGMSQNKLSNLSSVHISTINEIEQDFIRDMRVTTLVKFAKAFDVKFAALLVNQKIRAADK